MTITPKMLDALLEGCERPEDLLGEQGLMSELERASAMGLGPMAAHGGLHRMLGAELTEHLGYEHGAAPPVEQANRRDGATRKMVRGQDGAMEIAVPRDRDGGFEPRLIPKGQTRTCGLDDKSEPRGRHRFETRGERHVRAWHERARQ